MQLQKRRRIDPIPRCIGGFRLLSWGELMANQVRHPPEPLGGRSAGLITMRGGTGMSMQKINDTRAPNHKKVLITSGCSPTSLTQETVNMADAIRTDRAGTAG